MNDIFDRLAALRAAAEARAQRIHERALALEVRRRELNARTNAIRHITISPPPDADTDLHGDESVVSVSPVA